jgi:hypothetical protein
VEWGVKREALCWVLDWVIADLGFAWGEWYVYLPHDRGFLLDEVIFKWEWQWLLLTNLNDLNLVRSNRLRCLLT